MEPESRGQVAWTVEPETRGLVTGTGPVQGSGLKTVITAIRLYVLYPGGDKQLQCKEKL